MKKTKFAAAITTASAMLFVCAFSASAENYAVTGSFDAYSEGDSATVTATVTNDYYYDVDGIGYSVSVSDNAVIKGETSKTDVSLAAGESDSLTFEVELLQQEESSQPEASKPESSQPESSEPESSQPESSQSAGDNPNTGVGVSGAAIAVSVLALAAVGFAAVRKKKQLLSLILCVAVAGTAVVTSLPLTADAEEAESDPSTQIVEMELGGETVTVTLDITVPEQPEIHDNSEEDIQRLNDGKAVISRYTDSGEISFINGKYTDYKVTDPETAFNSTRAVDTLLNSKDVVLAYLRTDTAQNGDTFYTFTQMQGIAQVSNAFIKIGVDKDGNTISLSSSIDPDATALNISEEDVRANFEKAIEAAEKYVEENGGTLVPAAEPNVVLHKNAYMASCFLFYVKLDENPNLPSGSESSGYLKLLIETQSCTVYDVVPVKTIDSTTGENVDNSKYFDVETEQMEFTDYYGQKVTLPVAKNDDGYYFVDPERKIICVDSWKTFDTEKAGIQNVVPVVFASAEEAPALLVSIFSNMRTIYDFYAAKGIKSLDGNGLPLLLGLGFNAGFGQDMENAAFTSVISGFGCFMFGNYPLSSCFDFSAHEFTHGIKACHNSKGTAINNAGSIEESYADILGNLIEMQIDPPGCNKDIWYIGEQQMGKTSILRCMSDPHSCNQPEYVGDVNFVMNTRYASSLVIDDSGGVHVNNSILPYICYQMDQAGISLEDNFDIWAYTLYTAVPDSEYKDIAEMLKLAVVRLGFEDKLDTVSKLLDNANLYGDTTSWDSYERPEGSVKLEYKLENVPEGCEWSLAIKKNLGRSGNLVYATADENNVATSYTMPEAQTTLMLLISMEGKTYAATVFNDDLDSDMSVTLDFDELELMFLM